MKRILIVEDDEKLNEGIKLTLRNDYSCAQAFSLRTAGDMLKQQQPDLILLDVNLPDGNGLDFLKELRKTSKIPVIMLTVNKMEMDIVTGLELGANDYITKPFSLMVLRARVGVQLRNERNTEEVYRSGNFYFDFYKMEFLNGIDLLELSKTEQRLLRCLLENKGKSVSRGQLIDQVWQGDTEFVDEHALTVAVNRLRNKLGDNPNHPEYIKTVYGIGYTWTK
ncbi:response regulator transcription factor [Anaerolentibacter hominis]|uniref:response regulator transcription factor n=1 Tax=Anaerolentibacter hominis TaxID=3079009 RepID=UPI0031B842DD